ncbi:Guanosine-diphosphatase [Blastocladiella emersonii ATCC 22665]|nr:Guanosine-diphosphatase [Blastocladiella emersonii ATCC 22665]
MKTEQEFTLLPVYGDAGAPARRRSGGVAGGARPPRTLRALLLLAASRRGVLAIAALVALTILVASRGPGSASAPAAAASKVQYVGSRVSSKCGKQSAVAGLPPVEYGLMVDAGSTGSRIHVYRFNHCRSRVPEVENEVFEQLHPGLSAFAASPPAAADSLRPLLDIALQAVPEEFHSCTPIQVKATAGLRLLGTDTARAILDATRAMLHTSYPFPLVATTPAAAAHPDSPADDSVAIMDGADEGVFAWVTINSLLDSVRDGGHTAAIMDLGGASTQIVFAPASPAIPDPYRTAMSFAGTDHLLYQHSYLGYGLKEALKSIRARVARVASKGGPIAHPCYAKGYLATVDLPDLGRSTVVKGLPDPDSCTAVVKEALFASAGSMNATAAPACTAPPCSFAGVHHPDIPDTAPVFAFSYFYDLLSTVLDVTHAFPETVPGEHHNSDQQQQSDLEPEHVPSKQGTAGSGSSAVPGASGTVDPANTAGRHTLTLAELDTLQRLACTDADALDNIPTLAGHPAKSIIGDLLREDPDYCASLTYLAALLRGYRIAPTRPVTVMKKIRGFEMGWCLGATMTMLDAAERIGGKCRVPSPLAA